MSFKQWSQALYSTRTLAPSAAEAGDPFWDDVVLLLRYNGALFADASSLALTVTTNGTVSTTTGPFAGTTAAVFNGSTSNYLQLADSAAWDFGTGDFTVESWIKLTSIAAIQTFVSTYGGGGWELQHRTAGFVWGHDDAQPITNRSYTTTGTWVHVAVTREGSTMRMFFDGTQQGASVTNTNNLSNSNPLLIGKLNGAGGTSGVQPANAAIYDLRITKGVARYTANFPAPTEAFLDY